MNTLQETYHAMIYQANREGLAGHKVVGYQIFHPKNGTDTFGYSLTISNEVSDATVSP